jgi:hypothetical protein
MKSYITQLRGLANGSQTLIQNMVAKIAQEVDIQPLSLYYFHAEQEADVQLNSRLDGIIGGIEANDTVIIQTPTLMSSNYSVMLFEKLLALRQMINIKLIAFVENICGQPKKVIERYIALYNNCDELIVSNQRVVNRLKEYGLSNKRIIIFDYFDYEPALAVSNSAEFAKQINYIGEKPAKLDKLIQTGYTVTSFYKQEIENDLIVNKINQNGGFGLLWSDDQTIDENYEVASPIELGIFLSAGMPTITKRKYACAKIIEQKHLGFAVDNIDEATDRLQTITDDDYHKMIKEVEKVALITRDGISIKRALIDAIFQANLPQMD